MPSDAGERAQVFVCAAEGERLAVASLIVGREPEQRQLAALVTRAAEGTLQVGGIEGPPGIGKTALLEDTISRLDGWTVLRAHPEEADPPLKVIRELCATLGSEQSPPLDLGQAPALIGTWMCEQIAALDTPVCLAVDGLLADDVESCAVLRHLARQAADLPVLVVVSTRPGEAVSLADTAREPGRGGWIHLQPLQRRGVRQLFAQRLNIMVDSVTLRRILDATDGYPNELDDLLRRLVSSDDPGHTLTSALTLVRLQPPDRALADRIHDVLGRVDAATRAAAVAIGLATLSWEDVCRVVDGRGMTLPRRADVFDLDLFTVTPGGALRVQQHRVAQAVVDEATPEELHETHVVLSKVLDGTPALLHRVQAARDTTDDPGLAKELAERSLHHLLLGDAETCFELAHSSARLEPVRVAAAALAAMRIHRPDLVVRLERLIGLETRLPRRHALAALLSVSRHDLDEAADELARVDPVECDDRTLIVLAHAQCELSRMHACGGEYAVATAVGPAIRRELEQRRQVRVENGMPPEFLAEMSTLIALLDLWTSLVEVDPADGGRILALTVDLERALTPWPGTERASSVLRVLRCVHLFFRGHYDQSAAELVFLADTPFGDPDVLLQWACVRFHLLFQAGRWDEALEVGQHALGRTLDRLNDPARLRLAEAVLRVDSCRDESIAQVDLAAARLGRVGHAPIQAVRDLNSVWHWVAHGGDPVAAAALADDCWRFGPGGMQGNPRSVALLRVRAHVAAGSREAARAAYDDLCESGVEAGVRTYLVAHANALLSTGPEVAHPQFIFADEALTTHLAQQAGHGLHLFRAVLAEDWAVRALEASGALPPRLSECLVEAVGVVRAAGASRWRDRLVELSAQVHGRSMELPLIPTQRPREDADLIGQLTTREREIAWLVADGLTNREIAGVLSISVRTVEFHISNALAKLGLPSRVELRTELRRSPRELS